MLYLAGKAPGPEEGAATLKRLIDSGEALEKLRQIIDAQRGDSRVVDDTALLPRARHTLEIRAGRDGFVQRIKAESVGLSAMMLGAGRETKESEINLAAGVVLHKKVGDPVSAGEVLAVLHTDLDPGSSRVEAARRLILGAFACGPEKPAPPPLILGRVDRHGAVRY